MDYFNSKIVDNEKYLNGYRKLFKAPLVDRSWTLDRQHIPLTFIPEHLDYSDTDFDVITDARAIELLEKAKKENKVIRVSYSGGIDSVTAVCGLLKFKDQYPEVDIEFVLSALSIVEYPQFYEKYIRGKFNIIRADGKLLYQKLTEHHGKDFIIVTGELGDQLFGSSLMFKGTYQTRLDQPWDNVFTKQFVDFWRPLIMKMPHREKITVAEVYWWFNFVLKYQWVQLRMYAMVDGAVAPKDIYHFFAGDRYQNWAMITPMADKFPDLRDSRTYKYPAKKYIFDFTGDENYFKNKRKVGSLKDNIENPIRARLARITRNFKLVEKDETD